MKLLGEINDQMVGLIFDIDDTLYPRTPAYRKHVWQCECELMAQKKNISVKAAEILLFDERERLIQSQGRQVTTTEIFYSLGFEKDELQAGRSNLWQPQDFLTPHPVLHLLFKLLFDKFRIAFGTNSPRSVGERILKHLGFDTIGRELLICGPESFSQQKPAPGFFLEVANLLELAPGLCLSIGDREFADGVPAIEAGYGGALVVDDVYELVKLFRQVAEEHRLTALIQ